MPALKTTLQSAIDKPLYGFTDITKSYTRLLSKEKVKDGSVFTEKSQRPISELNVLPKYGSIKIFVDQLRSQVLRVMKDNQYAFPGKGGPMAIVKTLDDASQYSAESKRVLILFWDFSNAFCTTIHGLTIKIAEKYNLSGRMIGLLTQFLEQSFAAIKMSDKDGFYISNEIHTGRGSPQGQIGSDFSFAMINDGIDPVPILDEIINRTKYVDDFTDVMSAFLADTLFRSYRHQETIIKPMASSVGLKLNESKTLIVPMNFCVDELDFTFKKRYRKNAKLLEFELAINDPRTKDFPNLEKACSLAEPLTLCREPGKRKYTPKCATINGDPAASNLISRLNENIRTICTLRKHERDISKKVKAATALVWASCYDIGMVNVYCSDKKWSEICVGIRKVIKAAGIDHMTDPKILYRVSMGYDPRLMARKQIIQLGLKFLDSDTVRGNNYLIPTQPGVENRPFETRFRSEFSLLPLVTRKSAIDNLDVLNKKKKWLR